MRKPKCHRCGYSIYMILLSTGQRQCPLCGYFVGPEPIEVPILRSSRIVDIINIDLNLPLDEIGGRLCALFIGNGMTVSECARQLGITRATVYAKLRKYDLLKPIPPQNVKLHLLAGDAFTCGGIHRFKKDVKDKLLEKVHKVL